MIRMYMRSEAGPRGSPLVGRHLRQVRTNSCVTAGGRLNEKVAPPSGLSEAQICPRWASRIELEIASPIPRAGAACRKEQRRLRVAVRSEMAGSSKEQRVALCVDAFCSARSPPPSTMRPANAPGKTTNRKPKDYSARDMVPCRSQAASFNAPRACRLLHL
jgi:hypothetical protein